MRRPEVDHHLDVTIGKQGFAEGTQSSLYFPVLVHDARELRARLRASEAPRAEGGGMGELVDPTGHYLSLLRNQIAASLLIAEEDAEVTVYSG